MRDDRARLLDILEAIEKIEQRATTSKEQFLANELLQVWMIHHIQIIGEAAAHLPSSVRACSPSIPWEDVIAMRNVLVHQYFGIDLEEVWSTLVSEIPQLKTSMEGLLQNLPNELR